MAVALLHRFIDEVEVKRCSLCRRWLPLSEFTKSVRESDRLNAYCKECSNLRASQSYRKNLEGACISSRKRNLKRAYGITVEEYDALLELQGGVCAICGNPPDRSRLSVDHNHSTGQIRGLLCNSCNVGIGHFRDSQDLLAKASEYLDKWGA